MDINSTFNNFKNNWITKRVADPTLGQLGANSLPANQWYQCVSLIKEYLKAYGISAGFWGDAHQYYTQTNAALLAKFDRISGTNPPQVGDIVVLNGEHIAIASGNNSNGNMEILEQNGQTGGGSGTGGDAIRTRFVPISRLATYGLLRPNASVRAVAASAAPAVPAHQPQHVGEVLRLPDTESSWRVYAPTGPWSSTPVDYSVHRLNPKQYAENGFLEYVVLANPAQDIYIIKTTMFGEMAIWGGAPASFRGVAASAAPQAAPAPAPAPAPTPAAPSHPYSVEMIDPVKLVSDQPRVKWNLDNQNWPDFAKNPLGTLPAGQTIVAVAKAHHALGSFYYMEDAGVAAGFNVVDLQPYVEPPQPTPAPEATPVPVVVVPPADPTPTATPTPGAVVTPTPPTSVNDPHPFDNLSDKDIQKAKDTFKPGVRPLVSSQNVLIRDLEGLLPAIEMQAGKLIPAAGDFWVNGQKFLLTIPSEAKGHWYGIPESVAKAVSPDMRKKADKLVKDIYNRYKDDLDALLEDLFSEGMKFEEQLSTTTGHKLSGLDRLADWIARKLFGHGKQK